VVADEVFHFFIYLFLLVALGGCRLAWE
jgi:hypothetical protein